MDRNKSWKELKQFDSRYTHYVSIIEKDNNENKKKQVKIHDKIPEPIKNVNMQIWRVNCLMGLNKNVPNAYHVTCSLIRIFT